MTANLLIKTVYSINPKTIVSLCAVMLLICGIQGIGYAADPVFPDDDGNVAGNQTDRSVAENTRSGENIGRPVVARDSDPGDVVTYSITSITAGAGGDASGLFTIVRTTGQLQTSGALDHEAEGSYAVVVTATDGTGGTDATITVTITVTDVNEAPMFAEATVASREMAENTPSGLNIGDAFVASDPEGDGVTYSLDTAGDRSFNIGRSNGQLRTEASLDYEGQRTYTVTVKATDDGSPRLSATFRVTITVTDVNEDPSFNRTTDSFTINENLEAGTLIGNKFTAATDDDDDTLIYSLTGPDGSTEETTFDLEEETNADGKIISVQLKTAGSLNYETRRTYTVLLNVGDNIVTGSTTDAADTAVDDTITITITLRDVNDKPVFKDEIPGVEGPPIRPREVDENTEANISFGTAIEATDEDRPAQRLRFSLTDSSGNFDIDPTSGQLKTKTGVDLDFETQTDYTVTVTVTDSGSPRASASTMVTITVGDDDGEPGEDTTNNAPVFQDGPSRTMPRAENAEDSLTGRLIGELNVSDADDGETATLTYRLSGPDSASFHFGDELDSTADPRVLLLRSNAGLELDHEGSKPSYMVTVTATDIHGATDTIAITIEITDVDENPVFADGATAATRYIAEDTDTSSAVLIDTFTATDPDEGDTLAYTVTATESDGTTPATIFDINNTGALSIKAGTKLDHEADGGDSYTVTISVTSIKADGTTPGGTATITVPIDVTDVDEAPEFASETHTFSVNEDIAPNMPFDDTTPADVPAANDPEGAEVSYTYGGSDSASFKFVKDPTGETAGELQTKAPLDFEGSRRTYTVTVTASDGTYESTITITINVANVDEAPVFPRDSYTFSVLENIADNRNIGVVRATDPDAGDAAPTYAVVPDTLFIVVAGQLSLVSGQNLDYETETTHEVTVTATDDDGSLTDTAMVTINVRNVSETADPVNRKPVFIEGASATRSIAEVKTGGTSPYIVGYKIGSPVVASDADGDDLTYVLTAGGNAAFEINPSTGQLRITSTGFSTDPDHETEANASYTLTVEVRDNKEPDGTDSAGDPPAETNADDTITVTIMVTDVNEPPTFTTTPAITRTVVENAAAGEFDNPVVIDDNSDPEGDAVTYSLTDDADGKFAIDSESGQLSTTEPLDADAIFDADATPPAATYTIKVTATDDGTPSASAEATVTVTVTPVNDNDPVFSDSKLTWTVPENVVSAYIGTVPIATDADKPDQDITYTPTDGANLDGTDAFSFDAATRQLSKNTTAANYEVQSDYEITIVASDGQTPPRTGELTIIINVDDDDTEADPANSAPRFPATNTTFTVAENTAADMVIDTVPEATDTDADDTVTYAISGDDASSFDFDMSTRELKTKASLDHEAEDSYEVVVTASDDDGTPLTDTIRVIIEVTDVNEGPVFTEGSSTRRVVNENTRAGVNVGSPVIAVDEDEDEALKYSIIGSSDNFEIDEDTGQLKTKTGVDLDYERQTDYMVTVGVIDQRNDAGTAAATESPDATIAVTIEVLDLVEAQVSNRAPVFAEGVSTSRDVAENSEAGTAIGAAVTATDADTGDTLTYTLGGADAASFSIDGPSGQLMTSAALDFEMKSSYTVTVIATDTGTPMRSDRIMVTITVTNVVEAGDPTTTNSAPVFADGVSTSREVAENGSPGDNIGDPVTATDADTGDTLTYSLGSGGDNDSFAIVETSGQLQTKAGVTLDYEATKKVYTVMVSVTDNKNVAGGEDSTVDDTIEVTINVINDPSDDDPNPGQNDAPIFTGNSATRSVQAGGAGRTVGSPVTATDPDTGDTLTFDVTSGDTALFDIDSSTGQLSTLAAVTAGSHSVVVTVTDDGTPPMSVATTITITVTAPPAPGQPPAPRPLPEGTPGTPGTVPPVTNDPPVFDDGTSATRSVAENTAAGTNIGTPVGATDPNNDPLTYTLGGTDAASFGIDSTSGQLMTSAALDFEVKRVYTVTVTANDGLTGGTASITVTINVTDVSVAEGDPVPTNTAPAFASATAARSVAENTAAGGNIGAPVVAVDTDTGEVLTYTLGGTDAASFGINAATGQLMTKVALDHETKASYTVVVTATDSGGLTDSITVTITVTDVNEAPAFASATAERSVDENTAAGMAIGDAFTATDPDDGDTVMYSVGGTDMGSFAIGETTGQLMTMGMLDHETKASYTVMVIATDSGGLTGSITVTISVMDVNDAPMFASDTATRTVEENTASGMAIGDPVTAMDDDGDDVTYSLGGTDMGSFAIDEATGQLKTMADLDYEAKTSHTVMVTASDGTLMSSVTVTIMVTDVPEFMLSVPSGQSLIHVPLKMAGLAKISDLYDKLGGADNVNLLITYDATGKRWISYLGDQNRGGASDRNLTDDLGILADMKNAVTLQLSGDALGTNGTASIMLQAGNNLVGVPLKDSRITNVSDLLGLDDNISFIIVSDGGEYKTITRAGDPGDVAVTGGQAFILNATAAATVTITGDGWASSTATAAPSWMSQMGIQKDGMTAALAVTGSIVDEVKGLTDFHITVKNLSTGKVDTVATDANGAGYQLTFVDIETGRAAQIGDTLEITAQAADPLVGVEPLRYVVTVEDVKRGHIQLDALVTYEVPAKTELLRNYPNPFNPETWIPYRLAEAATVTLTIYNQNGGVVRDIHLGHQIAAVYETRSKAIYWDGRNNLGERVASGIYFYHLTAGDYSAVRKMVIVK